MTKLICCCIMQGQRFVDLVISCTNDGRVYLAAATDTSSFLVWDLETRRYHGTIIPSETKKRFRDRSGGKQTCTCVAASLGQSASLVFCGKQHTVQVFISICYLKIVMTCIYVSVFRLLVCCIVLTVYKMRNFGYGTSACRKLTLRPC